MVLIGWLVMAIVSILSRWLSGLITIGDTHPVEPMMIGIVLGAITRNVGLFPKKWEPFLKKFEAPLLWGVILLGDCEIGI